MLGVLQPQPELFRLCKVGVLREMYGQLIPSAPSLYDQFYHALDTGGPGGGPVHLFGDVDAALGRLHAMSVSPIVTERARFMSIVGGVLALRYAGVQMQYVSLHPLWSRALWSVANAGGSFPVSLSGEPVMDLASMPHFHTGMGSGCVGLI